MRWRRSFAVLAGVAIMVGAAGLSASAASAPPHPALHWTSCGGGYQCAKLPVPLDDTNPHSPTINLALVRLPAADPHERIGSLLVNPGGPGASAVQFVQQSAKMLPAVVRDRFDIVGFDPRGVGGSDPIDCTSNLDPLYNLQFAPVSQAAYQALVAGVQSFVAQCEKKDGSQLPYVSTERTARDMDRIRAALGDRKLTYLGYSYGTYLGALYADRYPTHIRAMVLDGAVDPTLSAAAGQIQQAVGFEHGLDLFLQNCADQRLVRLPLGREPRRGVRRAAGQRRRQPHPGPPGRRGPEPGRHRVRHRRHPVPLLRAGRLARPGPVARGRREG